MKFDAKRLTEFCVQRGLNVTQVAAALGVRETTATNWFDGTNAPGGVHALMLVDLLKVKPRDLLREEVVAEAV